MVVQDEFSQDGSIVRVRLQNFMTYDDVTFKPGPYLNMILGPNGTGKSAFVCSVILGLAGDVGVTGRGASPADFVKKTRDWGSTEIELYNSEGNNHVIYRKISITGRSKFKIDHKSEWKINGKQALKSNVRNLTRELHIKVDNLCQFLPQDSVTQFVKMSPTELLLSTCKAAGDDQLVDEYDKLKQLTTEAGEKTSALETLRRACKEIQVNAKRLESEVAEIRKRQALVNERQLCSQKIHYVRYLEASKDCKDVRDTCENLQSQLTDNDERIQPFKDAVSANEKEKSRCRGALQSSSKDLGEIMKTIDVVQGKILNRCQSLDEQFARFKGKQEIESQRLTNIQKKKEELNVQQCKLAETSNINNTREIARLDKELESLRDQQRTNRTISDETSRTLRQQVYQLDEIKREIHQVSAVKQRKLELLKVRYPDAYKAVEWLSLNGEKFQKEIHQPLMCEINVKDPRFNNVVENSISQHEMSSFVCQTEDDLRTFTRYCREELHIRPNVILAPDRTMQDFEEECARLPDLSQHGVVAYLKDLITAPDPIMRYLCGNSNFHRVPVARSCNETQLQQLMGLCPRFYVGDQFYSVSKSRYDNQTMTVTDSVREARLLKFSLDTKRLSECEARFKRLQVTFDETKKQEGEIHKKGDELRANWEERKLARDRLIAEQELKSKIENKIQKIERELHALETEKIDLVAEKGKLRKSVDTINSEIVSHFKKIMQLFAECATTMENYSNNKLLERIATQNLIIAKQKLEDAERDSNRLKEELKKLERTLDMVKSRMRELKKVAEEKVVGFKDNKLDKRTKAKFDRVPEETVNDLQSKIDELGMRIERIHYDRNLENDYNRETEELRDKESRIADLETSIKRIDEERATIKASWLPRLEEVISIINEHYQQFMRKLCYDGQVKLTFDTAQPDNFGAYGIAIYVKYRDNEALIPLSSTRQSGGERSVATMIYMLALQAKTTVPFRCVDEINQGMDKENERKVFELLVQTADSSMSQYFLVSPKLLNDLPYSPKMRIHIVFNGKQLDLSWDT